MKLAEAVDLESVAQATSGFAGADLNLVNEATVVAARNHRTKVEQQDLVGPLKGCGWRKRVA